MASSAIVSGLLRIVPWAYQGASGRVRKLRTDHYGYLVFGVRRTIGRVNRFVCEAFHDTAPSTKHEAAHEDGDRTNNVPGNLCWKTPKENHQDRKRHGTWPVLEKHPRAQLSEEDVREIKRIYAQRHPGHYIKRGTRNQLVQQFGVKVSVIKDIAAGRSWAACR